MADIQGQHWCDCNRRFATARALAQHKRDSPRHPNDQDQANAPNDVPPTLLSTDEVASAVVIPPPPTEPTASSNTTAPPNAGQSSSTAQKEKRKKKKGINTGATGQPSYSYASRTSSDGYTLTRRYNPAWESAYMREGPDHTECSSDCDWCGRCAYHEPY